MTDDKIDSLKRHLGSQHGTPDWDQCDHMAILFFNIWPFATMKMCQFAVFVKKWFESLSNNRYIKH